MGQVNVNPGGGDGGGGSSTALVLVVLVLLVVVLFFVFGGQGCFLNANVNVRSFLPPTVPAHPFWL